MRTITTTTAASNHLVTFSTGLVTSIKEMKMNLQFSVSIAVLCVVSLLCTTRNAQAVTIFAPFNSNDRIVGENEIDSVLALGYYPDTPNGQIGSSGNPDSMHHFNSVFGFLLPSGVGSIDSAIFRITNADNDRSTTNTDLWGLDTVDPDASGTSFFLKTNTDGNPGNMKLADNFFTTGAGSVTASIDITSYLSTFYTGGSLPSQSEVFLRINQDTDYSLPFLRRISIVPSSATLEITYSEPPVPEPSSFLLLGLGALGLIRYTRRRRRRA